MADDDLRQQIDRIRAVVNRDGGCTVGCDELEILCPDFLTVPEQFARIATIAQRENWSFAFLPDGSVRFGAFAQA